VSAAGPPSTGERIAALLRAELTPNPARTRAFLRTLVAVLLAGFIVLTFQLPLDFWTITFVLFVTSPTVGNSVRNAVDRVTTTIAGAAAGVLLVIITFDEPWLFVTLQALAIGFSLFLARGTPVGAVALTGGAAFAVVTGSARQLAPVGWITLAFYRVLQGGIGSSLGALAQLTFWPDDPLVILHRSLLISVERVEARLQGGTVVLDPASLGRQLELLANAEVRHPAIAHRRAELSALILDTARLVDRAIRHTRGEPGEHTRTLLATACARLRHVHDATLFEPPPAAPPPPPSQGLPWLSDALAPARRAALKTALSAFLSALFANLLQVPASGALFPCLLVGIQVSSGTAISKSLLPLIGVLGSLVLVMFVYVLAMPNIDDLGSFLVVSALALAPPLWLTVSGPRVRSAGFFGTVVMSQALFGSFRASDALLSSALTALALSIGLVVVAIVDRMVWPVDRRAAMWQRAAMMIRATAQLYRTTGRRLVLAPNREPRWSIHRHLAALVQLRAEKTPLPGTPWFAPEEEVLRLATETQHLVVARIHAARRELAQGAVSPEAMEARERIATALDARAAYIEKRLASKA
jgi:uncharacterized membrane protein YccC